jgi:hypothetical protein
MKRVLQLVYRGAQPPTNHAVFRRLDYGDIIDDVTKLFRDGHKDEATGAIPARCQGACHNSLLCG